MVDNALRRHKFIGEQRIKVLVGYGERRENCAQSIHFFFCVCDRLASRMYTYARISMIENNSDFKLNDSCFLFFFFQIAEARKSGAAFRISF